jgi:tetratricopeptide (TPR) repeat protein
VKFEWIYAFDPKTRFRLELKDEGTGAVVFDTTVFNTSEIVLDFKTIVPKMEQDEEERFELSIKSESDEWMDSNMIMLYDQDGAQKKLYEFINKARAFYGGNSAIENYVLGAIYERKNLFADAFQAYKKAHELAPHVKTFRDRHIEIGELPYNTK